MERFFEYKDEGLFCHHSLDESPVNTDFYMHAHERMELLLFISGDALCHVEGSEYRMEPYDVLIMRSAEVHRTHILSPKPYERIALHFSPALIKAVDSEGLLLRPFLERPLGKLNRYGADRVRGRLLQDSLEGMEGGSGGQRARMRVLSALMCLLSDISESFERSENKGGMDEGISARLVEYINAHLFEDISLGSLSRRFYMSSSQLNRVFGKATGSSVWEYVRIKRLLAAREKILAGVSAGTVCTMCGFKDYSAFYRAYKARFGHAPSKEGEGDDGRTSGA